MTKILLVEDSKFLRIATERALGRAGYAVITAVDGQVAIQLAQREKPDLVLLDMLLPKMTGPDVLKQLKKDSATAAIPVVVFTGLSQKNAERLQRDGACAFLDKTELDLEKGCDKFLSALAAIMRREGLKVPAGAYAHQAGAGGSSAHSTIIACCCWISAGQDAVRQSISTR